MQSHKIEFFSLRDNDPHVYLFGVKLWKHADRMSDEQLLKRVPVLNAIYFIAGAISSIIIWT